MSRSLSRLQRFALPALIAGLVACAFVIVSPFLPSIGWAVLLAYVTWPAYRRVRHWMGGRRALSALLAVLGLAVTIVLPLLWLIAVVQQDLMRLYTFAAAFMHQPQPALPDVVVRIPGFGPLLQEWFSQHVSDPIRLKQDLAHWLQTGAIHSLALVGGVGRNTAKLAFALVTLFFVYRDGETILRQVALAVHHMLGDRIDHHLRAAGSLSRTIVQGMVLAGLLQGLAAGLGYWLIGVRTPALLGVATAVASVIPFFGTTLVWGPVCISLFAGGNVWQSAAMLAWGILLIHPIDNILRPLLISSAARIPFLLAMFGALGGIAAFGLIGLFVGPVVLAVAIAAWREWIRAIDSGTGKDAG